MSVATPIKKAARPAAFTHRGIDYKWSQVCPGCFTTTGKVIDLFDKNAAAHVPLLDELVERRCALEAEINAEIEASYYVDEFGKRVPLVGRQDLFRKRLRGIAFHETEFRLLARLPDPSATFTGRFVVDVQDEDLPAAGERAFAALLERCGIVDERTAAPAAASTLGPLLATVDAKLLKDVAVAMYPPFVSGCRFNFQGVRVGDGMLAATDGKRMHVAELDLPANVADHKTTVVVPGTLFHRRVLPKTVTVHEHAFNGKVFKPNEGAFPKPEYVIPRKFVCMATVDAKLFLQVLGEVENMTHEESRAVVFDFGTSLTATVVLRARTIDAGEASACCPLISCDGKVQVGIDPTFLRDAFKFVAPKGGQVRVACSGVDTPVRITGPEAGRTAVVMPITVRWK